MDGEAAPTAILGSPWGAAGDVLLAPVWHLGADASARTRANSCTSRGVCSFQENVWQ